MGINRVVNKGSAGGVGPVGRKPPSRGVIVLEYLVSPGVAVDSHEKMVAIDQPCHVLHAETPPFGEIGPVLAEERAFGPVEKGHPQAVARDLDIDRLLVEVLVEMEKAVEVGGNGVEK